MEQAKEFIRDLQKTHDETTGHNWRVVSTQGNSEWEPYYGITSYDAGSFPNVVHAKSDWEGFGNGSSLRDATFMAEAHRKVPVLTYALERIIKSVEEHGSITKEELEHILVVGD